MRHDPSHHAFYDAEIAVVEHIVAFIRRAGEEILALAKKERNAQLVQIAKACGAEGVLWVLTKFCDPEEFDYVPAKEVLDAAGIPMLQIEIDQQMVNYEQVRTAIETFKDIL